jgi:PD-(D/E)XK nuclease superfamily
MMPNLFHFATSELSQDAFLSWLFSWADDQYSSSEPKLHQLARQLLQRIFELSKKSCPVRIHTLEVNPRRGCIDIRVKINEEYIVLIEDKVKSREHSNQLRRYLTTLVDEGHPRESILPVYIQTGEQSNYDEVQKAEFGVITRFELLALLKNAISSGASNAILLDFTAHLEGMEHDFLSYQTNALNEWSSRAWRGFFSALKMHLPDANWHRVPTPSGGFEGFWWHWHGDDHSEIYLQLEQGRLCFKLSDFQQSVTNRIQHAREWKDRLRQADQGNTLKISKPGRYSYGKTMTCAIAQSDYRVTGTNGYIDMQATLSRLHEAMSLVERVL